MPCHPARSTPTILTASARAYGLGSAREFARHHLLGRLLEPAEVAERGGLAVQRRLLGRDGGDDRRRRRHDCHVSSSPDQVVGPGGVARPLRADATLARLAPKVWIGGSPLRLFRLTDAGDSLLEELARRGQTAARTPGQARLLDRLVLSGAAHPLPEPSTSSPRASDVTVVVPVRDRPAALGRLLTSIMARGEHGLGEHGAPARIVVVDDGSVDAGTVADITLGRGATLVRHDRALGPAAARERRTLLRAHTAGGLRRFGHLL